MIPRIRDVKAMPEYCLRVSFDDGKTVLYDVKEDIDQIKLSRTDADTWAFQSGATGSEPHLRILER